MIKMPLGGRTWRRCYRRKLLSWAGWPYMRFRWSIQLSISDWTSQTYFHRSCSSSSRWYSSGCSETQSSSRDGETLWNISKPRFENYNYFTFITAPVPAMKFSFWRIQLATQILMHVPMQPFQPRQMRLTTPRLECWSLLLSLSSLLPTPSGLSLNVIWSCHTFWLIDES